MLADLHCDLLSFLFCHPNADFDDPGSRCSPSQLKQGNVKIQNLALFTETKKGSSLAGIGEARIFQKLLHTPEITRFPEEGSLQIFPSIENASNLLEEDENFSLLFTRFETIQKMIGPLFSLSLTWHYENRFGGGNETKIGLKEEGASFLEYLSGKGIAIDLSHTSAPLAEGILNLIEKKNLSLTPIATHSNFQKICNVPRNLSDDLAKEILRKGGVIGINFIKDFIGKSPDDLLLHIHHGISLGAHDHLCFGADFCSPEDKDPFFPELNNASCYPFILNKLKKEFSEEFIEKISYKNFLSFKSANS